MRNEPPRGLSVENTTGASRRRCFAAAVVDPRLRKMQNRSPQPFVSDQPGDLRKDLKWQGLPVPLSISAIPTCARKGFK